MAPLINTENTLKTEWFEAINIPGVNYAIIIYPNVYARQTWVALSLKTGKEAKLHATLRLSIESAGWSGKYVRLFEKNMNPLGGTCCETDDLLFTPYIVNGKMTVKCEGILSVERKSDEVARENKWIKNSFLGMTWNGTDTNFTIVVGEENLPVSFFTFLFIH